MFPSPVGELHFSIKKQRQQDDRNGFRPLSGNCISQFVYRRKDGKMVSVPCRGTAFLNTISLYLSHGNKSFPSPVGELHFSIPSLQSRHQSGLMGGIAWEKYFLKNK